jgi:phosphate:Na+ symporter
VNTILQLAGSLAFLLYGMKMMSDGIQKCAGRELQNALSLMTHNRVAGLLTGLVVTMIIQSSGATTVMVVSFVNAGLITLEQSVGVIFGANIGTTITAWIVALFGFNFNIMSFAVPVFGLGFILSSVKKIHKDNIGEALMGFGMLFIGLGWLSKAISPESCMLNFMRHLCNWGFGSMMIGVAIGIVLTALIHSSSATTAIVITMAYNHLLTWEFSAVLVIGSEIGSTIDAVLASFGGRTDAKRAALIHVMFNVVMAVCALIFLEPLLRLVDWIVPGTVEENIIYHIAMLHTLLKTIAAVVFLPFTNQIAKLSRLIIKQKENEVPNVYKLEFIATGVKESATAYIIRAEKEIADMTDIVMNMFDRIKTGMGERTDSFIANNFDQLENAENYTDQMKEQLTKYLVSCSRLPVSDVQANNLSIMLQIVDDLEDMTDDCFSAAVLLKRSVEKNMTFPQEDMDRLVPYVDLANQFLVFIRGNINKHLDEEKLTRAGELEDQIDLFRKNLKKVARKRLESGADVKAELLYIDLVRQIEKIGDHAFSIAGSLSQTV